MSLDALPSVSFAETDPSEIEAAVLTGYESVSGQTLYPGDPVRLFLESLALHIAQQNLLIDMAAKENLLAYATGPHLEHLGALMATQRLTSTHARTTLRFEIAEEQAFPVLIPAGTRVATADTVQVFATDDVAVIEAGGRSAEIGATSVTPGSGANGLVPGQISALIDPLAYVSKVTNTTVTLAGSDVETDECYRTRIQLAPESYTCAGSAGSYRYHALAVHQDIADVAVWCPEPGHVDVRPVMRGGELPDETLLETMRRRLNADRVRPLTDTVTVAAPEVTGYAIRGGWYLRREDSALSLSIQRAVRAAVESYRLWQRSAPGRDINPTRLISLVERAGAKRVTLDSPSFRQLAKHQIARETEIRFDFLGVEDE